ncbi:MAG: acyl carrier protein [Prevotellaceae bacterium]|jgi:acyl carrier protein|nr:acyl carrier protein [Prevotellaceae bacterium]
MNNIDKYNKAFIDVFAVEESVLNDNFSKETISEWDSVHQLNVITILEELFDIMLEPEDIMEFNSYKKGKEIIKKYYIEF